MPSAKEEILALAQREFTDIVRIRRDLHMNPEVGFEVQRTAGIVAAEMKKLGLQVKEKVGKTGVTADLMVDPGFPMVALRADMDALPMNEEANPPYKSKVPGAAHMCGHDAHTAMLIGAARILCELRKKLQVNVRFIFQPNEENIPGGAPSMIADGCLEGVREIFGLHVWPIIETGSIGAIPGPAMAQPDVFDLHIKGVGGHAAAPHMCIDPIVVGAQIVAQLQTIVSRTVSPLENAVLTVTQFKGGSTHNVIPETVFLQGTIRTFNPSVQKEMRQRLERVVKSCCESAGATFEMSYTEGYPPLVNDKNATEKVVAAIRETFSEKTLAVAQPTMGGEDFAYYAKKIPACFFFLGIRNEAKGITRMCHDPRFDIDEDALTIGMVAHAGIALSLKA